MSDTAITRQDARVVDGGPRGCYPVAGLFDSIAPPFDGVVRQPTVATTGPRRGAERPDVTSVALARTVR